MYSPQPCLTVSWSPSSVHTYIPRLFHGPNCFPVSTRCTYLGSRGYFGVHRRSCMKVILKLTLENGGWGVSYEIALRWMPQDLTDDKSTLVQVMVWCRQASSQYLSQCWPRSLSPYGVTRPQWVNSCLNRESVWPILALSQECLAGFEQAVDSCYLMPIEGQWFTSAS